MLLSIIVAKIVFRFLEHSGCQKQLTQQICCSSKSSPGRSQWHEWLLLHCITNYLAFQRYIVKSGKGRICQDKWPFSRTLSRFLWHEVTGGFATPPGWDVCPPTFRQASPNVCRNLFIILGGKGKLCKKVSRPRSKVSQENLGEKLMFLWR